MICGKCRAKIDNGLEACPHCGARFKKLVVAPVPTLKEEVVKEDVQPKEDIQQQEDIIPNEDIQKSEDSILSEDTQKNENIIPNEDTQADNDIQLDEDSTLIGDEMTDGNLLEDTQEQSQDDIQLDQPIEAKKGFLNIVKPFLKKSSRTLSLLALGVILLSIITAKIPLIKTNANAVEGFLKISLVLSLPALILGLAAIAAIVLYIVLPHEKEQTRIKNILSSLPTIAFAVMTTVVALVSILFCL